MTRIFRPFKQYRNNLMLDLDILVVKVPFSGATYTKLKVLYVYKHGPWKGTTVFSTPHPVTILNKDMVRWTEVDRE